MLKNPELKKDFFILFIAYFVAHGLILFNRGAYWDDWVLLYTDKTITIDRFSQAGSPIIGYFHNYILSFGHSVTFYHLITFAAYFLAAILLYIILENIREIGQVDRLFIVFVFLLFPVNSARITLICTPYAICYLFFFLGFYLINQYLSNQKIIYRVLALIFLFLSFLTNSNLVFYLIILLFIFYKNKESICPISEFIFMFLRYIDMVLLPILFFIVKTIYFVPYGLYKGYNQITLTFNNLIEASRLVIDSFNLIFIEVINLSIASLSWEVLLLAVVFFIFINLLVKDIDTLINRKNPLAYYILIITGAMLFFLAVFPYNVLNLMPGFKFWDSRHQLLVPLGSSLILYYGLRILLNSIRLSTKVQIMLYSLIIAIFININIQSYMNYQIDWYKQLSLIENIKQSSIIEQNTTFLFVDKLDRLNANDRIYGFYEYSGLMKYAFSGQETRFGINVSKYKGMETYEKYLTSYYNLGNYKPHDPEYMVVINEGTINLDQRSSLIKMIWNEYFNPSIFHKDISNLVNLEYRPLK